MIIECSSCHTRYHYDESRFAGTAVKKIRCTKCTTIFEIRNPAVPEVPPGFQAEETGGHNAPVLGADDFALDTTVMGGGPRKRPIVPPPLPAGSTQASPVPVPVPPRPAPAAAPRGGHTDEFPRMGTQPGVAVAESRRLFLPVGYRLSLACIAGPDSGRIFEIDKPRVVLGRANADILLTDSQCSRQHAAIEVSGEEATLIDLGSTNGSFVGEKRITRAELDNRMEFDLGATTRLFLRTRREGSP